MQDERLVEISSQSTDIDWEDVIEEQVREAGNIVHALKSMREYKVEYGL